MEDEKLPTLRGREVRREVPHAKVTRTGDASREHVPVRARCHPLPSPNPMGQSARSAENHGARQSRARTAETSAYPAGGIACANRNRKSGSYVRLTWRRRWRFEA